MPQSLDEAEFSFPSNLFNGADFLMDNLNYPRNGTMTFDFGGNLSFPNEFPYEFDSFRTSPVDSVVGSNETESSDEDDFLVWVTRRLAKSSLIETRKLVPKDIPELVWSGSPQSTLSGIGRWSGKSTMSSKGSPTGPFSQVPSPPASPLDAKYENWDLVYAAAGQIARMKMGSGAFSGNKQENRGLTGPTSQNITVSSLSNPNNGYYYLDDLVSHNQSQIQHLRVNQSFKPHFQCPTSMGKQANNVAWSVQSNQQQIQNRRTSVCESSGCGHPLNLNKTVSPSLNVHNQKHQTQYQFSASRPGLHGGSVVKKECAGTGVFLPRRYNHPESRKKAGVPKVDVAKTVQSQNINFQDLKGHSQSRFVNGLLSNHEAMMSRRNGLFALQRNLRQEVAVNHEIRLPQEWTY